MNLTVPASPRARHSRPQPLLLGAVHIVAMFQLAVVQPVFSVLAQHPTFFVARRLEPPDICAMVAVTAFAVPLLLVAAEFVLRRIGEIWKNAFHLMLMGTLAFLVVFPLLRSVVSYDLSLMLRGSPPRLAEVAFQFGLAAVIVAVAVALYTRFAAARSFVTFLSPAIVVVPGLFLLHSPVTPLLFPQERSVAAASAATADVQPKSRPPTVMVVFDELNGMSLLDKSHQIDSALYPNIAEFAKQAYWFRNATTNGVLTQNAVPSMLTGRLPDLSLTPQLSDHPQNLFTLLLGHYRINVREEVTRLCPRYTRSVVDLEGMETFSTRTGSVIIDLCVIFAQIIDPDGLLVSTPTIQGRWRFFDGFGATDGGQLAAKPTEPLSSYYRRVDEFQRFLDQIEPSAEPTLNYYHGMFPHFPYVHYPSGRLYWYGVGMNFGVDAKTNRWLPGDDLPALHERQRYLLQLGCVDHLIGRLVARLKAIGIYDESLIVLASDHGVSFLPGEGRRTLTHGNAHEVLPVFLMIKAPGQKSRVVSDRNVESIDLLPSICDVLDVPIPWEIDGQSALDSTVPERPKKAALTAFSNELTEFDGAFPQRYLSVRRRERNFPSGEDVRGIFSIGPHPELIGRPVSEFDVDETFRLDVRLRSKAARWRPGPAPASIGILPAVVEGNVTGLSEIDLPVELAAAVNGRIYATTRTYRLKGYESFFHTMLPEEAFADDQWKIELLEIVADSERLRLRAVGFAR